MIKYENACEKLHSLAYKKAFEIYGEALPDNVSERLNKELTFIKNNNNSDYYLLAYKTVTEAKNNGHQITSRGSIGSSFVAFLLGITDINPLDYNIPCEIFMGHNGDKLPDIILHSNKTFHTDKPVIEVIPNPLLEMFEFLENSTNKKIGEADISDTKIFDLFRNTDTLGLYEFDSDFMRDMLRITKPESFADLVKINGLAHATIRGIDTPEKLSEKYYSEDFPVFRDDVFQKLKDYGLTSESAYTITQAVSVGTFSGRPELLKTLQENHVPEQYTEQLKNILHLFPKSHSVAVVKDALRCAWFKTYYTTEFYAGYSASYADRVDFNTLVKEWFK